MADKLLSTVKGFDGVVNSQLSKVGGANKVLQFDANGDILTSNVFNNDNIGLNPGGNIFMPDKRGLWWYKRDGTKSGFNIWAWEDHGGGPEFIINSPARIALIGYDRLQVGANDGVRDSHAVEIVSGGASPTELIRNSKGVLFRTTAYNSGAGDVLNHIGIQAVTTNSSTAASTLKIFNNAGIITSGPSRGDMNGTLIAELDPTGFWNPGSAPAFSNLVDGPIITQTCSKFLSVQSSKVTLAGNRELVLSGLVNGMRGVIYVKQDAVGSRTLSLPSGSASDPTFALTTTPNVVDRLSWEYDGTIIYWVINKGFNAVADPDAQAFFTRASITDPTQKTAVNNLVVALKTNALWNFIDCIYPFVGGNATAHAQNLKANVNNIIWHNAVVHNANGITGNGTDAWGESPFIYSAINNNFGYVYNKTTLPSSGLFMGTVSGVGTFYAISYDNTNGFLWIDGPNTNVINQAAFVTTDTKGSISVSRSGPSTWQMRISGTGGTFQNDRTEASVALSVAPTGILAYCVGVGAPGGGSFSNANLAFAAFGNHALTNSEWSTFVGIVNNYQTALGRQV